jgi:hypothetical protein
MSLLGVVFATNDPEAIKRRISWLSEPALVVAWPDHIFRIIEHG